MTDDDLEILDDLLVRLRVAQMRPSWRRRVLDGAEHAISMSDLRVLRTVERRDARQADTSIGDVADDLGVEHSSASRAVTAAEGRGLLARTASEADQRRTCLRLTAEGSDALAEMTERRRRLVAEVVMDWHPDELRQLIDLMDRLADDLEGWDL